MGWALVVGAAVALAQNSGDGLDAHGFHLAAHDGDPRDLLTLQRPGDMAAGSWFAGGLMEYAEAPLVGTTPEGERVPVVDDLVALNATVGFVLHERVRVDALVPLFLSSRGLEGTAGVGLGDIRLAALVAALRVADTGAGIGLGAVPFVDLPAGDGARFLGQEGVTGGLLVAGTAELDALTLTANAGPRFGPSIQQENLNGSDQLVVGVGAGALVDPTLGVNGELRASLPFVASAEPGTGAPAEGLASVRWVRDDGFHFTGGLAAGMSSGVGAAIYRVFVGGGFGAAVDVGPADTDGDGLVDRDDSCPEEAETRNGVQDDDGCPESNPTLRVLVTHDGKPLRGATLRLTGAATHEVAFEGTALPFEVPPESMWKGEASFGACLRGDALIQMRLVDATLDVELEFAPAALVSIVVVDADGNPVEDATASFASQDPYCVPPEPMALDVRGTGVQDVGVGRHHITVEAPGRVPYKETLEASLGEELEVLAVLE